MWLIAQDGATEVGVAGGFSRHPIALWLREQGHEVTLKVVRGEPGVWLYGGPSPLPDYLQPFHWISLFCHALMPPDSYRTVTASECAAILARVVLLP
jgi:hypothetical protein